MYQLAEGGTAVGTGMNTKKGSRDVIVKGLEIDGSSNALKNIERFTTNIFGKRRHGQTSPTDDFHCTVCFKLLFDLITAPCKHTFCRSCLFQSMDQGNKCPLCQTVLFIGPRTCAIRLEVGEDATSFNTGIKTGTV